MSFFTSSLRSAGILSSQNPQQFGEVLRLERGPLSIPIARLWEKVSNLGTKTVDRQNLPVSRPRYQFTIILERIRKTVERVTLLQNLYNPPVIEGEPLTFEQLVGDDPKRKALLEKICPGIFITSPFKQRELIRLALEYQENRLNSLLKQMINWTFLQPDWQNLSQTQVFDMLDEVKGALTSKIKWISDPYIPFLKMAIAERAVWQVRSEKDIGLASFLFLFEGLKTEQDMIFGKVLDMYYNTFLGADHPKVQENLRNHNDLCKIEPEDVKAGIIDLQLKAIADYLSPNQESQKAAYTLLLKLFQHPDAFANMDTTETKLYDQLIANWAHLARSDLEIVPLEYFVTHVPQNPDSNPQIARDLAQYQAIEKQLSLVRSTSDEQEARYLRGSTEKLEGHKCEILRLVQIRSDLTLQKMELERKLSTYPKGLEEKATDLQIQVWQLEAEIQKAGRVMRFFLEGCHEKRATSLKATINLRAQEFVDQAKLDQCTAAFKQVISEIAVQRSAVLETEAELVQGRALFRETYQVGVRKAKTELHLLASKVYYLTPQQLETLMKTDDNQRVME